MIKTYIIRQADTEVEDIFFMAEKAYKPVKNSYATLIEKPFFALTAGECDARKNLIYPPSLLPIKETIAYDSPPEKSWRLVHDGKKVLTLFEGEGITSCKWVLFVGKDEDECLEQIKKLGLEYNKLEV